jgi:hypothetical protein
MPILNTNKPRRNNPSGEAQARQQRIDSREANNFKNSQIPVFTFRGLGFRPYYGLTNGTLQIEGPLCPSKRLNRECYVQLEMVGDEEKEGRCPICDKTYDFKMSKTDLRGLAHADYKGLLRFQESDGEVITLDVPYEAIKAKAKDETREIKINWSQKDGRNQAVIYLIDTQARGKKAQIFVDFDREEVRHDAGDQKPGELISKIKAEFPGTEHTIEYNE